MHPLSRTQLFWLTGFLVTWTLFGLTGRGAWQADEALALGRVIDWRAGHLTALYPAPLYTLLASLAADAFQPWLGLQDAARLASGGLILASFLLTGLAARELYGPGYGPAAALALLGGFGLMLRAHALLPGTALLAGYALLIYGVALARRRCRAGGAVLALALITLALGRGLPDLVAALMIMGLPLLSREWRGRSYRQALAWGLAGLVAGLALWLGLLASQDHAALARWWSQATAQAWPTRSPAAVLNLLSWFAWPLWPLALWAVWHEHRRLGKAVELHPVMAASLVLLVLAHWPAWSRDGGALPLLIPLALLAAHGVVTLRRGAAQAFYWFGVLCFLFFALAFWVYFSALEWGWPTRLAAHLARLTPDYHPGSVSQAMTGLAVAATLLWCLAIPLFPRAKARPVLVWATGMALSWVLLIALFRPWAEAGWGYRPLLAEIDRQLPAHACLHADVDPAMRVMLRAELPQRLRPHDACGYFLTSRQQEGPGEPIWSGARPRYKHQVYYLYRRGD